MPPVTAKVVKDIVDKGYKNIWLTPGAENDEVLNYAKSKGINLIAGGPDILAEMGEYRDDY